MTVILQGYNAPLAIVQGYGSDETVPGCVTISDEVRWVVEISDESCTE